MTVLRPIRRDASRRADEVKVGDSLAVIWRDYFDPPFVVARIEQTTYQGLPALMFTSEPRPDGLVFITECAPHHMVETAP